MSALGPAVTAARQHAQVLTVDHHRRVMPCLGRRVTDGDQPRKTPVHHVPGKMQLQTMAFVVGQVVARGRQQVRASHRVGGLRTEQPEQLGRLVIQHVKPHLSARTRRIQGRFAGGDSFQGGDHAAIVVFDDFGHSRQARPARMRPHPQMERFALGVVPNVSGVAELHDVRFEPSDRCVVAPGCRHRAARVGRRVERDAEIIDLGICFQARDRLAE